MKHINNYTNFLTEGINDNFLYHNTNIEKLIGIINDDKLKIGKNGYISFSRNKNYWFNYIPSNSVRLVLDKRKLSNKYKIENFDFFHKNNKGDYEYEEIIKSDISDLGKYIYGIDFSDIALGYNKDYKPLFFQYLSELKEKVELYTLNYPHIKLSVVNIDNKYIKGGEILIKNTYPYDKEI